MELPPIIVLSADSNKGCMEAAMNSVRIVADSGCDLSPALAEEYQITIIPVFVRFGQEMVPSDHLTNEEFWQRAANFRRAARHFVAGARHISARLSETGGCRA